MASTIRRSYPRSMHPWSVILIFVVRSRIRLMKREATARTRILPDAANGSDIVGAGLESTEYRADFREDSADPHRASPRHCAHAFESRRDRQVLTGIVREYDGADLVRTDAHRFAQQCHRIVAAAVIDEDHFQGFPNASRAGKSRANNNGSPTPSLNTGMTIDTWGFTR